MSIKLAMPEVAQSIRNQHYVQADTASVSGSYLHSAFASIPHNLCVFGSFWLYYPAGLSAMTRILLLSLGESMTVGSWAQGIAFTPKTVDATASFILGEGTVQSTGDMSISVAQTTADLNMTPNKWYHITFLYNSSDPTQSSFTLNGVASSVSTLVGSSSTQRSYTTCRLLQYRIPSGMRIAQFWMSCGTMTPATFAKMNFGKNCPFYMGADGAYANGIPPVVYMHNQSMTLENTSNNTLFTTTGTPFTSVVHSDQANQVKY